MQFFSEIHILLSMEEARARRLTGTSERIRGIMNELEQFVLGWARRKGYEHKLAGGLRRYRARWEELEKAGMENAEQRVTAQAVMSYLFSNPERSRMVLKAARDEEAVSTAAVEFLTIAAKEPWFMTAVEPLEPEGEALIRFLDYDDGNRYIAHSPDLIELYRREIWTCYGLFFYNGACFQNYGQIYYLEWAGLHDLQWFARRLDEERYEREGLMEVMTADPLPWIALFAFAELPRIRHRGSEMEVCDASTPLRHLKENALPGNVEVRWSGKLCRITLDREEPFFGPKAVWDRRKKRLYLRAMSPEAYRRGRMTLLQVAELPEEPESRCSGAMFTAAHDVLGSGEFSEYESIFADEAAVLDELFGRGSPAEE